MLLQCVGRLQYLLRKVPDSIVQFACWRSLFAQHSANLQIQGDRAIHRLNQLGNPRVMPSAARLLQLVSDREVNDNVRIGPEGSKCALNLIPATGTVYGSGNA